MEKTIEQRVKEILATQLGLDEDNIKLEDRLQHELGADSLDAVELVMELEEAFETDIPDDDAEKLLTVADIITWLEAHA